MAKWRREFGSANLLRDQCPLFPRKRTLKDESWMSALCQKRTLTSYAHWNNTYLDRNRAYYGGQI